MTTRERASTKSATLFALYADAHDIRLEGQTAFGSKSDGSPIAVPVSRLIRECLLSGLSLDPSCEERLREVVGGGHAALEALGARWQLEDLGDDALLATGVEIVAEEYCLPLIEPSHKREEDLYDHAVTELARLCGDARLSHGASLPSDARQCAPASPALGKGVMAIVACDGSVGLAVGTERTAAPILFMGVAALEPNDVGSLVYALVSGRPAGGGECLEVRPTELGTLLAGLRIARRIADARIRDAVEAGVLHANATLELPTAGF